ncbi:MAG: hypothetical protein N2116_01275 [Armatimonadetes bacterium]|nr:hypothetical protein [Armatimonadota bacterium]
MKFPFTVESLKGFFNGEGFDIYDLPSEPEKQLSKVGEMFDLTRAIEAAWEKRERIVVNEAATQQLFIECL